MIRLRPYTEADAPQWDAFVDRSVNATFLLRRGYMDYHADRFLDCSIVAEDERGRIVALLPACERIEADGSRTCSSHAGLTYGGWLLSSSTGTNTMMELFALLTVYLRQSGFSTLIYKQIPTIYHRIPAQEDEYALWRLGATLEVCNIATTLDLRANAAFTPTVETRRRRGRNKAEARGYTVRETTDLTSFWPIVEENLRSRYGARPVHTLAEMELLRQRFPEQIRCLVAERGGALQQDTSTLPQEATHNSKKIEGGILYFVAGPVVHIQYPHATPEGKEDGVMDLLYSALIEQYKQQPEIHFFDFGTSNEEAGRYLNATLVAQKEGFGGRGVAYRIFRLNL
jgi:hypothetical protein